MITLDRAPVQRPAPRPGGATRLGVARIDLTPELGVPLSGYGPAIAGGGHRWARGLAGRLHATAVVIDPPDGDRLAIVAVDLHVASRIVTELVARHTARLGLGPAQLLIGATHTHSGPGHLYGTTYYDAGASNGDRRLDLPLVQDLGERIARAIEAALDDAARGGDRRLRVGVGVLTGATWNRSFEAFAANWLPLEEARDGRSDEAFDPECLARVQAFGDGCGKDTLRPLAAELSDLPPEALPAEARSSRRWAVQSGLEVLALHGPGDDPRGSLRANVSNATVRCLSNMKLADMLENRHAMSQTVRDEVSPKSNEWGYKLGSVYIRKVHFRDAQMIRQIEEKVVNRLRQVTSAIRQDGANQVSLITSSAERQAAVEFAKAAALRPKIVGEALQKIGSNKRVSEVLFEILETQKLLESGGEVTLVPQRSGELTSLLASGGR